MDNDNHIQVRRVGLMSGEGSTPISISVKRTGI